MSAANPTPYQETDSLYEQIKLLQADKASGYETKIKDIELKIQN